LEYVKYKLSHPDPPPPHKTKSEESDDSSTFSPTSCRLLESWEEMFTTAKSWLYRCASDFRRSRYQ
jgi:hypothetical protein